MDIYYLNSFNSKILPELDEILDIGNTKHLQVPNYYKEL